MTAAEYAQTLQLKPVVPATATVSGGDSQRKWRHLLLKDFTFFYVSGELTYASQSTKKRMDYIHCRGGIVLPAYDPELVTHIIVDTANPDKPDAGVTLRTLGLKKLSDIPDHVPTVKWKWVNSAKLVPNGDRAGNFRIVEDGNGGHVTVRMDWEFMHSAFVARVHAGKGFKNTGGNEKDKGKGKPKAKTTAQRKEGENSEEEDNDSAEDISDISCACRLIGSVVGVRLIFVCSRNFTQDAPSPPPSAKETTPAVNQTKSVQSEREIPFISDPLGEFEALAKEEKKAEGFLCDAPNSNSLTSECPNQDIVDKLEELMELHRAKPTEEDKWRVYSYSKSIRKIRTYPHRITSYEEARNIPGVGDKTALKIKEILETGELRRIDIEYTEDLDVVHLFQGIYGVGQHIAYMWYSAGCRTLDDIRERKNGIKVSDVQEIGLKYYDDINTRMPRAEAGEIFTAIKRTAVSIDPHLYVEIMGSYRRGKATCGDIDILITRPTDDGNSHEGVLASLLSALQREGIIRENLSMPDFKDDPLEAVYRGLCVRPLREGEGHDTKRLVHILTVPYKSRGAALIYYTGDDIFNRSLRLKANKMGYSLNQRGLFAGVVRSTENKMIKTCDGHIIASETEQEIFRILGVPWQEPWERVRS
ncbi:Nucleotidyltransferase [Dentipellis sp. KUC8613]|nr:Nucleotidyltransferase [Dentipellis sp. KUC8613]